MIRIIITLIIAASVLAAGWVMSNTIMYVKTLDSSLLTVTGSATETINSDQVKWPSNFTRQVGADALRDGYAQMARDTEAVKAFFQSRGVTTDEVAFSPVLMTPLLENCGNPPRAGCTNSPVAYRLQQNTEINSKDVDKITRVAQDVSPLINQGVVFSSQRLEYYYGKLAAMRVQLLATATKDAQTRAEQIAGSTGAHLGKLTTASSGVIQVTPVNSTQISDQGSYDTTTIQKQVTAVVRASFTLTP